MINPAGVECPHYYQDFMRGSEIRRCQARRSSRSDRWDVSQCGRCPVPGIVVQNGSPQLQLTLTAIRKRFLRPARVLVEGWCIKHALPVPEPHLGCAECNAGILPDDLR